MDAYAVQNYSRDFCQYLSVQGHKTPCIGLPSQCAVIVIHVNHAGRPVLRASSSQLQMTAILAAQRRAAPRSAAHNSSVRCCRRQRRRDSCRRRINASDQKSSPVWPPGAAVRRQRAAGTRGHTRCDVHATAYTAQETCRPAATTQPPEPAVICTHFAHARCRSGRQGQTAH